MAHLQRLANGHLVKNAAGHLALHICAKCPDCDNDYEQYQIVVSGVSNCPSDQCYWTVFGGAQSALNSGALPSVNGTYIVTRGAIRSDLCVWDYAEAYTGGVKYYQWIGTKNCGPIGTQTNGPYEYNYLLVRMEKRNSTTWRLVIGYTPNPPWNLNNWPYYASFFASDYTVAAQVCPPVVIPSGRESPCPDDDIAGYLGGLFGADINGGGLGGIATITPVIP